MNIEVASLITKDRVNRYTSPGYSLFVIGDESVLDWEPPEGAVIKVNCDGSWFPELRLAGYGCIASDKDRCVLGVRVSPLVGVNSSLQAEGLSLSRAMHWASAAGWEDCKFEIDCSSVLKDVLCGSSLPQTGNGWAKECSRFLLGNRKWRVSLVRREANFNADVIARKAALESWTWSSTSSIPCCVDRP